jgi:hypothetical protein
MPIRPETRWLYPIDWRELSRVIRFGRAKGRCEVCRRPHRTFVCHLGDGRWFDEDDQVWRDGHGRKLRTHKSAAFPLPQAHGFTFVVLACAHLDHDPTNNVASNLASLCQRCHMLHDAAAHRRQRWWSAFRARALGDLLTGPYS